MSSKWFKHFGIFIIFLLLAACGGSEIAPGKSSPVDTPPGPADLELGDTFSRQKDGMTMVFVPGGEFIMGRRWRFDDHTHTVVLDSFWIDRTEVTNANFTSCVEAGVCSPPVSCSWGEPTYQDGELLDHPVICVSWQIAADYCRWAGARLPTEAEWEYAARGPEAMVYPWGDTFNGSWINFCDINCPHEDHQQNDYDDGYAQTAPVGSYPSGSSWCGALDLIGNVWEWVADWHGPYPWVAQSNPKGPETGTERIIRGGSWFENNDYGFLRGDNRHPYEPLARDFLVGFRCAMPSEE